MIVSNPAEAKRWPTDEKKTMAKTLLGEILLFSDKGFWWLTLRLGLKSCFNAEKYIWTGFVSALARGWTNAWFYCSGEIWLIHSQCRFNGHCTMRIILLKSSNRVIFFISSFVWQHRMANSEKICRWDCLKWKARWTLDLKKRWCGQERQKHGIREYIILTHTGGQCLLWSVQKYKCSFWRATDRGKGGHYWTTLAAFYKTGGFLLTHANSCVWIF